MTVAAPAQSPDTLSSAADRFRFFAAPVFSGHLTSFVDVYGAAAPTMVDTHGEVPDRNPGVRTQTRRLLTETPEHARAASWRCDIADERSTWHEQLHGRVCEDVSERLRSEADLRASESLFRALFEGSVDSVLLSDRDGRYTDANSAACALFGLPRDQLIGRIAAEFTHESHSAGLAASGSGGTPFPPDVVRIIRADGGVREAEAHVQGVRSTGA